MTDLLKLLDDMKQERSEEIGDINGKVLIVDAMNSYIRTFAAVPTMNEEGDHVGGMSGFLKSIGAAIRTFRPSRCILVFDGKGGSQRRRKLYPEYKENRRTMTRLNRTYDFKDKSEEEQSMRYQLVTLAHMLKCLPVTVLAQSNVEADDVIAFIAQLVETRNGKSVIMSTDKDFLQVVNEKISVFNPIKKRVYEPTSIVEEYGIHPNNFAVFRAIDGDPSDNIPGISGIGRKTLLDFLPHLSEAKKITVADVVAFAGTKKKSKLCQRLVDSKDIIERNYELMQLDVSYMSGTTKMEIIDRLDKGNLSLDKLTLNGLIREHHMINAFGAYDQWLLTTFAPLLRFVPLEKSHNE